MGLRNAADGWADRALLAANGAAFVVGLLALWFALTRPTTPNGGRYGSLVGSLIAALVALLLFPILRGALYRRISPGNLVLALAATAAPWLLLELFANAVNLRGFLYYAETEQYFRWQSWSGTP